MADYVTNGKNFKIKSIDLNPKDKYIACCYKLPFGIRSLSRFININKQ